ncbi:AI-2E family transporter YdiK [Desulfobulbus propionicus]|jgi:predicted PurR-regulated permease PerM
MKETRAAPEIVRSTLAVLFIGLLLIASLWVLRPFLFPLTWAVMIVVATWPFMLKVQQRCWNKRWLAVVVMSLALLLFFVIPLSFAILTILERTGDLVALINALKSIRIASPPEWFEKVPLISHSLIERWQRLAVISPQELSEKLAPHVNTTLKWFVAQVGNVGLLVVQFVLTVILCAVLYAQGENGAALVRDFARRLAGARGEEAVMLSGAAIRSVALGIVGTAIVQATLGGFGLIVAGVPAAALLIAVMMLLCIAQIGPGLVLFPAVIWMYWNGAHTWATILLVWSIPVAISDNFLRPYLIKKGADLPMILIITGVIGGLLAFGVIGLFIGPVVLAVTYTLLVAWIKGTAGDDELTTWQTISPERNLTARGNQREPSLSIDAVYTKEDKESSYS